MKTRHPEVVSLMARFDGLFADPVALERQLVRERVVREKSAKDRPWRENSFTPEISYGRHRGPAPRSCFPASVLAAILPKENRWVIPLTLRPTHLPDHAGQVSLPGGRREGQESAWQTACREMNEELGFPTESLMRVGELPRLYVYASRHDVTPVVAVGKSFPELTPCPEEVAQVLLLPIEDLLELAPTEREMTRGAMLFRAPGFWVDGHWVWGATAMILGELRDWLLRIESLQE